MEQFDATRLVNDALVRSGVSLFMLTDAALGELDMKPYIDEEGAFLSFPEFIARHRLTGPPPAEDTYDGMTGSIASVVGYISGSWDGGLEAVVEDCEDSRSMARFIGAVVELISRDTSYIGGITIERGRLYELTERIRPYIH